MRHLIPVVALSGFLGACGTYAPAGSTAEFSGGYTNGCLAGYEQGGRGNHSTQARDEARYQGDAEYRNGWDEGFEECFNRAISQPHGEGGATH
jgi:hypothetical protein